MKFKKAIFKHKIYKIWRKVAKNESLQDSKMNGAISFIIAKSCIQKSLNNL